MSLARIAAGQSRAVEALRAPAVVLAAFTATIFLSALLLFSVQPMFAKMVLPKLGGSPSVWAVCMVFFQAVLLVGYAYAFALNRLAAPQRAVMVHVAVMLAAVLALPIGLPSNLAEPPATGGYLWLTGVLAAGVGLPFFALSANAPLLQSWFGRMGQPQSADPYFLYGASNVGSLAALLLYPVLVEPLLRLGTQAAIWTSGFVLLGGAIALCGLMLAANAYPAAPLATSADESPAAAPANAQRLQWIALAAVPSALLVAFTTYVSTDIASAPFLWVVPLALFLATFTAVFRTTPLIPHEALLDRQPMLAGLAIFGMPALGHMPFGIGYIAALAAFIVTCLVCHRELYLRRPALARLTEFYLWMSFGGVLGGVFSALVAPLVFSSVIEFPLVLAASVALTPAILDGTGTGAKWRRPLLLVAGGLAVIVGLRALIAAGIVPSVLKLHMFMVAPLVALVVVLRSNARMQLAAMALIPLAVLLVPVGGTQMHVTRSFFGVHRVVETPERDFRLMYHGTTVHGARRIRDAAGSATAGMPVPATYYYPGSPMARSLGLVSRAHGAPRLGVVGLGSGAMACNGAPRDTWRFFEIDQAVVDIARDPRHFDFLDRCLGSADIVVGDARLTLAKEAAASFDYLLVDAFSSDSIPAHLLTVEAMALYLGKLRDDGLLAFHLSNHYLDLVPVVAANIAAIPGLGAVVVRDAANPECASGYDAAPSTVVLISRDAGRLAPALAWRGAAPLRHAAGGPEAWTDDFSDIVSALVPPWRR